MVPTDEHFVVAARNRLSNDRRHHRRLRRSLARARPARDARVSVGSYRHRLKHCGRHRDREQRTGLRAQMVSTNACRYLVSMRFDCWTDPPTAVVTPCLTGLKRYATFLPLRVTI